MPCPGRGDGRPSSSGARFFELGCVPNAWHINSRECMHLVVILVVVLGEGDAAHGPQGHQRRPQSSLAVGPLATSNRGGRRGLARPWEVSIRFDHKYFLTRMPGWDEASAPFIRISEAFS